MKVAGMEIKKIPRPKKTEGNKSELNDGLSSLVKKWEKDLKKYGTRIDEEANKANHDGVTALAIMRSELRGRLKELRQVR